MSGDRWVPETQREHAVYGLWKRVNEIACSTEDSAEIRKLIAEAGIEPGVHCGTDPDAFTPLMVGEWVLGQWADMIDAGSPFLNSGRNISLSQFEKLTGEPDPPWTVGQSAMHLDEIHAIVEHFDGRAS
jgi:hypothetical protein